MIPFPKSSYFLSTIGLAALLVCTPAHQLQAQAAPAHVSPILVTSPSFSEGGRIPTAFTCVAGPMAKSPQLEWSGITPDAKSVVLYFHDLDPHPNGGSDDVLHWVVWNLPTTSKGIPAAAGNNAGALPGATQGLNTHGTMGYSGPCPPFGQPDHHYVFEVFALNKVLPLTEKASRHDVLDAMNGSIVGHGVLVALFSRRQ